MKLKINANKLKHLRDSKCWSQQQLSELSGLSLRTIQRIESKSVASQESIKCLASVFEISVNELFATHSEIDEQFTEALPNQHLSIDDSKRTESVVEHNEMQKKGRDLLKQVYIGAFLVFLSHMFGFYGIFTAFDEQRIDVETFQLLKDSVSIVLIISSLFFLYQVKKITKKYKLGSSFL